MELFGSTSRGGFSVRGIFTFVLVVVVTALLWVLIGGQPAHAADANWSGESIIYDGHGFTKTTEFNDSTGTIPDGATVYQSPPQTDATTGSQKVFIIYFSPGVDPPIATNAKYVEFNYSPTKVLSNPQNAKDISLTKQGEESEYTSCSVGGIGWIVCPVSVFFAEAMDNIFAIFAGMIQVQPSVLGDQNNSMYVAWNIMRNIANIAFVIAFLIIIYSQLTSLGVSNYGLKKLLPRLIVAAVLVNISYIVAAIAIDISNILGFSIQNIFNTIREDTFHITNDNFSGVNNNAWTTVTTIILAGGGVIGGVYFLAAGSLYLLIPLLLGLLLTIIFVVVVLAARQAIIVILVIIAPLAFVANLLPNTEKWFDKWKDLFFTMLIFFPAFSLVFGGSQLAGQIIIQNAGDSIVMVLFGMAVQVAPLVITPLLLKFSGSLLGRIAQIANNPRKGIMDRAGNWAERRAEHAKQQNIAKGPRLRNPASWGAGMVRNLDQRRRRLDDRTALHKLNADNRYHTSWRYADVHEKTEDAQRDKRIIDSNLEIHSIKQLRSDKTKFSKEMTARVRADQVVDLKGRVDNSYEDLKSGQSNLPRQYGAEFMALERQAVETTRSVALNAMRQQSAKRAQTQNLYDDLKTNTLTMANDQGVQQVLREYAGGVQGHIGAQRALAQAISEQQRAHNEVITNANAILDDFNLSKADNLKVAKNMSIPGIDISITPDIQEAAIKRVASDGYVPAINELLTSVDFSPAGDENYRVALVEALRSNGNRPKYIGQGTMDQITQGINGGITPELMDNWIESMLVQKKLSAAELSKQDNDTLIRVREAIPRLARKARNSTEQVAYNTAISNLREQIDKARKDQILWNAAGERVDTIEDIERMI